MTRRLAGLTLLVLLATARSWADGTQATDEPVTAIGRALREVQQAADRDDRDAFNDRLAAARDVAARVVAGAQKHAVAEVLRTYGDLARVWDYRSASPSGAFFDDGTQGGTLLAALRAHPGYDEFIAPRMAAGRYYPTRETRQFLADLAEHRLKSVHGVPAHAGR